MTDIGGGCYMGKSAKGLPSLKRSKLSKNHKRSRMELKKKLYEANKWWNDWSFQLHRNKLEWVDPKNLIKRDKPYSVSFNRFYLNKNDRKYHWVGHSQLKELYTIDFFERKHMNNEMESELLNCHKWIQKPIIWR